MTQASTVGGNTRAMAPFNISLLSPDKRQLQKLREVSSLDIFEGHTQNFHQDGLFSTLTFGRMGEDIRSNRFGYIDLKIPILHPVIFSRLIKLKSLYLDILMGRGSAVFDPETKDFVRASVLEGRTGYAFFMRHLHELTPARTGSATRDLKVELLDRYRDKLTLNYLLVLPAGLRDLDIGTDGRVSMDEVNELYQKILMQTRVLPDSLPRGENMAIHDRVRFILTQRVLEIYEYFERLLSGKHGFIQARWASRRIFDGTRNVLSSLDTTIADLDQPNAPGFNDTVIGIYQAAKALMPKAIYYLSQGIVGEVFNTATDQVELVDPKTLKRTWVEVSGDTLDRWTTTEGHEKIINELEIVEKRHRPVLIDDYYLALVYADNQQNFRILRDIDELPIEVDRKFVHPITYVELVYLSGYRHWNDNAAFVTRYPIEQFNSSYPCMLYVKTTTVGEMRYELDANGDRIGKDHVALEFPKHSVDGTSVSYHDSTSVNPSKLEALGGDPNHYNFNVFESA